jgi:hypothetical protein
MIDSRKLFEDLKKARDSGELAKRIQDSHSGPTYGSDPEYPDELIQYNKDGTRDIVVIEEGYEVTVIRRI